MTRRVPRPRDEHIRIQAARVLQPAFLVFREEQPVSLDTRERAVDVLRSQGKEQRRDETPASFLQPLIFIPCGGPIARSATKFAQNLH